MGYNAQPKISKKSSKVSTGSSKSTVQQNPNDFSILQIAGNNVGRKPQGIKKNHNPKRFKGGEAIRRMPRPEDSLEQMPDQQNMIQVAGTNWTNRSIDLRPYQLNNNLRGYLS